MSLEATISGDFPDSGEKKSQDFALPAEKTKKILIFDARPPDLRTICALTQPPDLRMRIARKSDLGLGVVECLGLWCPRV